MINVIRECLGSTLSSQPIGIYGRLLAIACTVAWVLAPSFVRATITGSSQRAVTRPTAASKHGPGKHSSTLPIGFEQETPFMFSMATMRALTCVAGARRMPNQLQSGAEATSRIVRRNSKTPDGINLEGPPMSSSKGLLSTTCRAAGVRAVLGSHVTIQRIRASHNGVWGILTGHCDDLAVINNQVSNSVKEHGIYVGNSGDRPLIYGNVSWGNRRCGIHMNGDMSQGGDGIISNAVVESNLVFENGTGGGSGINCDGVENSTFQNNLLYNNHASGISLYRIDGGAGSTGNSLINNTIVQAADGRWAVNIVDQSTNNVIVNNILFHRGSRGSINVAADSLSGLHSDYNIVLDRFSPDDGGRFFSLADWQTATGLDRHSKVSTPRDVFVNFESNDYHLRDGSPALDAADLGVTPSLDIERKTRPIGARPDIGAFRSEVA